MHKMVMITSEKSTHIVDKLEDMKEVIEEIMDCFTESMMGERGNRRYRDDDEEDMGYRMGRRGGMRSTGFRRGY